MNNNNTFLELRREALQQLLIQAKKAKDKPLYRQLKLKLKQIQADTNQEDSNEN